KVYIDQIQQLKLSTLQGPDLDIPAGCTGPVLGPGADPIAGTWQTGQITEAQWVRAFVAGGGSEKEAHSSFVSHSWSWRFANGSFWLIFQDGSTGDSGTYSYGTDQKISLTDDVCTIVARYDVLGNTMKLHVVKPCDIQDQVPYGAAFLGTFPLT